MIMKSAIKKDNVIHIGLRHSDIIRNAAENGVSLKNAEQGFVNEAGEFLTRKEALIEAYYEGQITKELYLERLNGIQELFSEDIW